MWLEQHKLHPAMSDIEVTVELLVEKEISKRLRSNGICQVLVHHLKYFHKNEKWEGVFWTDAADDVPLAYCYLINDRKLESTIYE